MNLRRTLVSALLCFAIGSAPIVRAASKNVESGPVELRVNNLTAPLGIDDPAPKFSWQLRDPAPGAKQTAYRVDIASAANLAKANVWTSGRVESNQSLNIRYAGPVLKPSTRYFLTVTVWGKDGKTYPAASSWFETGLMQQEAWTAQWIGYETPEENAVRHAPAQWIVSPDYDALRAEKNLPLRFAYRTQVLLNKAVKRATLYATGQDTVSAWVNGAQVLEAQPFPAWHQMPWKKFVRTDVTGKLANGANTLAIEGVTYSAPQNGPSTPAPVIATLFIEYADGAVATYTSSPDWKTAVHAPDGWQQKGFDDAGWKHAEVFSQKPVPMMNPELGNPWISDSVKALRHDFDVKKPIKSARLYSTALGMYEMFLNGKRVSDDYFAPGWTDYREHVNYQTYDVANMVSQGQNAIGALLAPGWYSTPLEWYQQPNNYGVTPPALRAQLRIEHTDGSVEWVATDSTWQAKNSEILNAELYDGETHDARQALPMQGSWLSPHVNPTKWPSAIVIEPKSLTIHAQEFQPIRIEREMPAKALTQPKPGVYIYDFGQNMAAIERLRISGTRGTNVQLRFGELLNNDGTLYTENLRTAKATDHFILAGSGVEEFTPQFTFHGFRYAEITGLPTAPSKDALTALVIHTDAPFTAELKTGNAMINQLWSNIVWGQRSNFVGVPTDCPQRDERLGWMADAQVFWRTASYNADLAAFSRKFSADMRGTQAGTPMFGIYAPGTANEASGFGAGWSDAGVIIPWTSWLQTGDTSIIDQNWDAMVKYVDAIEKANPDGLWAKEQGIPFGDWLSPEGRTDQTLIGTAEWAYDVTLLRQMADATGRKDDAKRFAEQFETIKTAFQKRFVHEDGFIAGADNTPGGFSVNNPDAKSHGGDTQTGYVLALHMNLLPDALRAAAANKLVAKIEANHGLLATGFLGTPYLLEELTKTGHADLAYKLLLNTQYPSWGYLIEHGATTTWERWNGDQMKSDPSMNSYNHYAYGAVADWIYRYAAGVDASPLDAGFHTIVLHPIFDVRLGSVDFNYESAYGPIHSEWKVNGATATWHITIPPNTTGRLSDADAQPWHMQTTRKYDGRLHVETGPDGQHGIRLEPGTYEFTATLK